MFSMVRFYCMTRTLVEPSHIPLYKLPIYISTIVCNDNDDGV